jgi:hypothetical protein
MIYRIKSFFILLGLVMTGCISHAQEPFTQCAGAFLNQKLVVDDYSPAGKSEISLNATGELTVCTAEISEERTTPLERIKFKIALKKQHVNTIILFSDTTYKEIKIEKVLSQCKSGDRIILITVDDRYSLPHHEILVL